MATRTVNINDVLDGHVTLDPRCLDRIYLNGYLPTVQVGGQVGAVPGLAWPADPSSATVAKISDAFRVSVRRFTEVNQIPVFKFAKGERKVEVLRRHVAAQAATGRRGYSAGTPGTAARR